MSYPQGEIAYPTPTQESLPSVTVRQVALRGVGGEVRTLLYEPALPGPHPGVVLGAEATGVNAFLRCVAATLASIGFICALPDYYRGNGPANPEGYDDLDDILDHLGRLDFVAATGDVDLALDALVQHPRVDPTRIAVWGYCTGATLALLAAATRNDIAAAVLFYPSQPTFETLDFAHPVNPFELLWALRSRTLLLYGTEDVIFPPAVEADLRSRIEHWPVDAELAMYEGAGHAFCSPDSSYSHPSSASKAWQDAVAYLMRELNPTGP